MRELGLLQKCCRVNFSNWLSAPRTWLVFGVMAVFTVWNLSGVVDYSVQSGIRITPWIYPHYFSMPVMWLVYGFLTVALFSDAPFRCPFSDFMEIRTGKRIWITGQCLFVAEVSLCYSLAYFFLTILVILPRIFVTDQWGRLVETFLYDSGAAGSLVGIGFMEDTVREYTPVQATVLTILMVWLVSCLVGMLVLAGRIVCGENVGNSVAGFFVFLSYFCAYIGSMVFGGVIYRFSPVSWINIAVFRDTGGYPDLVYGFSFLLLAIVACSAAGVGVYCRKDGI